MSECKYKNGIEFKGESYRNKVELAEKFNVRYDTFIQRLGRGWTIEEALELKPRPHKGVEVQINNQTFVSKKEAADAMGMRPDELNNLLLGDKLPKTNKKAVIINGVEYKSKAEAQRKLNLERWQLEAILQNKPKRSTEVKIVIDGKEVIYSSIRKFCFEYNLDYSRTCNLLKKEEKTAQQIYDEAMEKRA